jgi:hypothetical protein
MTCLSYKGPRHDLSVLQGPEADRQECLSY